MGTEENADLVRRGYAAFSAGDMATLGALFADDAVWRVAGSNQLSGDKKGRDAILGYFGELVNLTGGNVTVTLQDVIAGPEHTIGLHHNHAERDGKSNDQEAVLVFTIQNGQVTRVQEFYEDTTRNDAFWG